MDRDFKRMGRTELLDALNAALKEKESLESQKAECLRQCESARQHLTETESRLSIAQTDLMNARADLAGQQERTAAQETLLASFDQQLQSVREQLETAQEELASERSRTASLTESLRDEKAAHTRAQEKIDALTRQLSDRVILKDSPDAPPKTYHRDSVTVLPKERKGNTDRAQNAQNEKKSAEKQD